MGHLLPVRAKVGGVGHPVMMNKQAKHHRQAQLKHQLFPGVEPFPRARLASGGGQFQIVVGRADREQTDQTHQRHLHVKAADVGQQHRHGKDRRCDENPAHGRGVGLLAHELVQALVVELGLVADLQLNQPADHRPAGENDREKADDDRRHRAELNPRQHLQRRQQFVPLDRLLQRFVEQIQHRSPGSLPGGHQRSALLSAIQPTRHAHPRPMKACATSAAAVVADQTSPVYREPSRSAQRGTGPSRFTVRRRRAPRSRRSHAPGPRRVSL